MPLTNPASQIGGVQATVAMSLRPSRSNATNGDTIYAICKIVNNTGATINDASLTFNFAKEFDLTKSNPLSVISGKQAVFQVSGFENKQTRDFKVWATINSPDARTGATFSIDATWQQGNQRISKTCAVIMVAHNIYPDMSVELRETRRVAGTIDYNLKIVGGYPPYEYYIDWGDGSINKGGLREEGTSELTHTYENSGEYRINAYINDYLGKQAVIRKRVYLDPWGAK